MIRIAIALCALLGGGAAFAAAAARVPGPPPAVDLVAALPPSSGPWKAVSTDEYDPKTIFRYLDGAGEVYRSYNFRRLAARRYGREGAPAVIVDLFDMGSDRDAYGIFTHDLDGVSAGIGRASAYRGGLLTFWTAAFFVSVYAEEETAETKAVVMDLGTRVAGALPRGGDVPDIVSRLPPEGLAESRVRYFHTHFILNSHFFVADRNILALDASTEAVLGEYGGGPGRVRLLLARYPSEDAASAALASFVRGYMPDAGPAGTVRTEDGRWTGARSWGPWLAAVFGAPEDADARRRLDAAGARIAGAAR